MEFPVVWQAGAQAIPAHAVLEFVAYPMGIALLTRLRANWGDPIQQRTRMLVVIAAAVGAVVGSKLLFLAEQPALLDERVQPGVLFAAGKSVVGGLLGGLLLVELAKWRLGESRSTGDLFVLPLCLGMAVGRIGCFLGGLEDDTYGVATSLPWGVDFGDGIPRHPTQLYEIVALGVIAAWAIRRKPSPRRLLAEGGGPGAKPLETMQARSGDLFRGFMILYLGWRLAIDFAKPMPPALLGLTAIQFACVAGILYYSRDLRRVFLASAEEVR